VLRRCASLTVAARDEGARVASTQQVRTIHTHSLNSREQSKCDTDSVYPPQIEGKYTSLNQQRAWWFNASHR
jgi:hypothetical protein